MTQPLDILQPAAFTVPPHVIDGSGLMAGWFTEPPGVVLQLTRPARGTVAMAEWLVGEGYAQLTRRFPDERELRVVMDMRQMTGRSATARSVLIEHAKLISQHLGTVVIVPSLHLGSLYIKVIEATALMLRAFGVRIEIETNLERAIAQQGLRLGVAHEANRTNVAVRSNAGTGRVQL